MILSDTNEIKHKMNRYVYGSRYPQTAPRIPENVPPLLLRSDYCTKFVFCAILNPMKL